MPIIESKPKNRKNCECCSAGYVINGDESGYWCEIPWYETKCCNSTFKANICDKCGKEAELQIRKPEGLCESCKPNQKWYVDNMKCHAKD